MKIIRLGKIVNIKTGKLDANAKVDGGKYPFFTCSKEISKIDSYSYDCECILVAGNGDLNVKYYNGKFDAYQRTYIIENNFSEKLDMKYLYYFMNTYIDILRSQTIGGVIKYIKLNNLTDIDFPLPSLQTQTQITTKLDKLSQLITLRKQSIKKQQDLTKSIFIEMFGDPMLNEKDREVKNVIDVCDCIVPGRDKPKSFTGNIPWIKTEDIIYLGLTLKNTYNIGLSNDEIKNVRAKIIPKNSVVMTCVGDLGIISILGKDSVINQQLHSFQCSDEINNYFLMYLLTHRVDYMYKMATSTTVPYMNKTACNSIPILLPPLPLQTKFAKIVQKNEEIIAKQKESLEKLEELYNATMQESFRF